MRPNRKRPLVDAMLGKRRQDRVWMLHNMDYANRTSFNRPLIITVGFTMAWLAVTGFWLLFRTMRRHDFAFLRRK